MVWDSFQPQQLKIQPELNRISSQGSRHIRVKNCCFPPSLSFLHLSSEFILQRACLAHSLESGEDGLVSHTDLDGNVPGVAEERKLFQWEMGVSFLSRANWDNPLPCFFYQIVDPFQAFYWLLCNCLCNRWKGSPDLQLFQFGDGLRVPMAQASGSIPEGLTWYPEELWIVSVYRRNRSEPL